MSAVRHRTDAVGSWRETHRVTVGQWETVCGGTGEIGLFGADSGQRTADSRQQAADSRQRTAGRPEVS